MTSGEHQSLSYQAIFGILCLLTAASVLADYLKLPGGKWVLTVLVLGIASAKASFVLLYFMHLKFERAWKYALIMPTVILSAGLLLAMFPDIALHYYPLDVPQVR